MFLERHQTWHGSVQTVFLNFVGGAQVGFSALPAALLAASHLQLGQFREAEAACEVNGEGASYVRRAKWTHWMKVQVRWNQLLQPSLMV